jgi:hypothetical protein
LQRSIHGEILNSAHLAQWQSTPLVRERSRVRFPEWAPYLTRRAKLGAACVGFHLFAILYKFLEF